VQQLRVTPPRATAGIWRVGDAVLKVVHDGGEGSRWPSSSDPAHPYYWRREPLAYASGLLEPFGAPACRAIVDRSDGSVALWLDAVPEVEKWTPPLLGVVARRLGRARAGPPPDAAWLSRDWLRAYLQLHGVEHDPQLDELPQTFCHFDFHPGNVLGPGAEVVVDWAYAGVGPRGSDPGVLVADGVADGAFPAELADDAAEAVWDGYLAGLREGGWSGDEDDVRAAFFRGTATRLSWLPRGEKPEWDATIDLLDRWRELA
jgi:Phosphotransferase enzyme family